MKSKATAAGVAALINKAQRLRRQSAVLIKQAQDECKHPNVTSYRLHSEFSDDHADIESFNCGTCGKRWYSDD